MKSILEEIPRSPTSSFRVLVDPDLRDFYYWHFHPEIEIVYIEGVDGNRHIGSHKSRYSNGDLAMIGSYIPHLNFDYGVKGHYQKTVLQMDEHFLDSLGAQAQAPELGKIKRLLNDARFGLVFSNEMKDKAGPLVRKIANYKGLLRFTKVLELLDLMADKHSYRLLLSTPYEGSYYMKQRDRFQAIIRFIEANYHKKISLKEVSEIANYSPSTFCRYFKRMTKLSFTDFLNNYRIDIAKRLLREGKSVSEAAYSTGFESLSYFHRIFKKVANISPSAYKKESTTSRI